MQTELLAADQVKREDPRYLLTEDFQVKILFTSDNPRMLGRTFSCSAIDVSKNGIHFKSLQPLVINSVLDLSVTINDSDREFLVTGDVKWCKHSTSLMHSVGIQLKSRAGTPTDLEEWKNLIKHIK